MINKITKKIHKLCIMNYALCIAFTTCANPDAGINYPDFFTDVKSVSAGGADYSCYTVALKEDGTVWAWGSNGYGQLGDGTTSNRYYPVQVMSDPSTEFTNVKAVSAGYAHTVALKEDGTVWVWGRNNVGQLGDGSTDDIYYPVQVMSDVIAISAGYYHILAIDNDNNLWAWGYNSDGQLGDGTRTDSQFPVKVHGEGGVGNLVDVIAVSAGNYYTLAIDNGNNLWAWGQNSSGQLGDGSTTRKTLPVKVMSDPSTEFTNVKAVSAGEDHTVAVKQDGTVWAWGSNNSGKLGDDTTTDSQFPVKVHGEGGVGNLVDVIAVSAGWWHTVAVKEDGTIWAWGSNYYGQLGDGTKTTYRYPVKIGDKWAKVSAGYYYTVAIKRDKILWAWGYNEYGQLGDGTRTDRLVPKRVIMPDW